MRKEVLEAQQANIENLARILGDRSDQQAWEYGTENQIPPWLTQLALRQRQSGEQPCKDQIQKAQKSGGTDHPDPTLRTMGRLDSTQPLS